MSPVASLRAMEPQAFHSPWPVPVTCGPVSSPGSRRISPWEAEVPKSPPSSCPGPLHLPSPRLGAATGCCHWVHANSKYLQHRVSSSSQGAVLAPPQDSGPPTSRLQEQGWGQETRDWRGKAYSWVQNNALSEPSLHPEGDNP